MTFYPANFGQSQLLICSITIAALLTGSGYSDSPDDLPVPAAVNSDSEDERPTLEELKQTGFERSRFSDSVTTLPASVLNGDLPRAKLDEFAATIKPLLEKHCIDCHGPDAAEGNIRLDTLSPDLLRGGDTEWWSEVFGVVAKEEMPPPDSSEISEAERRQIVNWLSSELQAASLLKRSSGSHSTFRRLTRYEYNYALQDLLGLPWDFAKDLPPEPHSAEGFENSSALLHLSVTQFETYHRLARQALARATVFGERPQTLYWGISMGEAAARQWVKQAERREKAKKELADDPVKLQAELMRLEETFRQPHRSAYYQELSTGRTAQAQWDYPGAKYAFAPTNDQVPFPATFDCVAILPPGLQQKLIVELGNQLPDEGMMRVTVRASRVNADEAGFPSLQLWFGWQASNEGRALLRVSNQDVAVTAMPDNPQIIQWDVPLGEIYPRNTVRKTSEMGELPSPSEYIRIVNSSAADGDIQIDFVSVEAPFYDQWPPASHRRIFFDSDQSADELVYAKEILQDFMSRAWRRPVTPQEIDRKLQLFVTMRTQCESFEEAICEVLATVLSSSQFLYVADPPPSSTTPATVEHFRLANRLALFLWSSIPDKELSSLASSGELARADVLARQVDRMLADPRCKRFSEHFVHQWLNLELLEFVNFKRSEDRFDPLLKEAMLEEPVALFETVLHSDASVLDFVHADYAMVNERMAKHYGMAGVYGNEFRRVPLDGGFQRGGLLTQAGPLAMNSAYPDSHPLKRAIWLLERLLDDPPPPPPPAVPQIDLANPEIAKMTLKERIEDHRNQAACLSCHSKIDPWGIAFENYDALGQWRDKVKGKPVDAASELFNRRMLDGMDGLKRYLLEARQDQFVLAMVDKLTTYGLGRPLGFGDRAEIETIAAEVRREGDGLRTMIQKIVESDLFRE
jgi:hypothetical protein